jgi:hypothetical protein
MSRNLVCTECGGTMEMGIVVDHGYLYMDAAYWIEGHGEKLWDGLLKLKGKKKHGISALRCETCGFLKFYAGPDLSESN